VRKLEGKGKDDGKHSGRGACVTGEYISGTILCHFVD